MLKKFITTILIALTSVASSFGQNDEFPDSCSVSLITCYPGPVVFELYGHTAIRVRNADYDLAYNFGMFSFSKPNFIYSFVKGETDYMLGYTDFEGDRYNNFIEEFRHRGSRIVEQELNLSRQQAVDLWKKLCVLSLPENREYRYNYVYDNCATRPRDMIEAAVGGITYPTPADTTMTFRDIMRSYSPNYPWYQFGIDLVLGPGIDFPVDVRERQFAPILLMEEMAGATYTDSIGNQVPVVKRTNIINEGTSDVLLPPTPWWASPTTVAIVALAIVLLMTWLDIRRRKVSRWFDSLWFFIQGIVGCLIAFLVFFSEHEATSPNFLIAWLNPLCLLPVILIWIKRAEKWLFIYHFINFAVVFGMTAFWWALPQVANPAIFPLIGATLLRSANYLYINRKCNARKR